MNILAHYTTLLNILFQYGTQPPMELMDRLWEELKASDLKVYISKRGLEIIEHEISVAKGKRLSQEVMTKLMRGFKVCPRPNDQKIKEFLPVYGGKNYEEALEIGSAHLNFIDYILSDIPYSFHSFGLEEIKLN
ncbi:hypothetical protein IQ254_10520 [Nodosilinea sp. LEGE 07088]|uniref:hypothetical protein n=1 Tax=Nodosilinea sp. LEGE 07088 TaxID=2777968 RepID=UPI001880958F|nr:hypothetical protein [Nodosilinea sp. LEGE 07088]MBE9137643.1 hypothetical protein [Nodosilinea sp. LEGE 07088]